MAKEIDFLTLEESPEVNQNYPYSLEAWEYEKPSGGCRCKSKEDLRTMYTLWKEVYGTFNLKYMFKYLNQQINL